MSSEERLAILKMLSEGKISVDEAEKLLRAVGEAPPSRRERRRARPRPRDIGDLVEDIGEEVRQAVKSVQASEIGRVVSEEVSKAVSKVQQMDVGGMVGEIVDQVTDAVSEVVEGVGRKEVVEEQDWTLEETGVERVEAETTNGTIDLEGRPGPVAVRAWKKVRARTEEEAEAFARQVQVHAVRVGEAIRVYKEHPKPPRGVSVEVRYEIGAPQRMDVDLRTVNGTVTCRGTEGEVQAQSTNGNVKLEGGKGRIQARVQNGNLSAAVAELRHEGVFTNTNGNVDVEIAAGSAPITATSTNGNVGLLLPDDFGGRLDARTTNGNVHSDVELTNVEKSKRTELVGQIGAGGEANIRLHTLNGSVHLRRRQQAAEEA